MRLALASFGSFASSIVLASLAPSALAAAPPAAPPPAAPPSPAVVALAPPPPPTPPGSSDLHLDLTTLKLLRDRAQISQAEYEGALRDMNDAAGSGVAAEAPTFVLAGFSTTIYGRAKADFMYDTTQSYGDLTGNALLARPANAPVGQPPAPQTDYAGQNPRAQFSMRDSRLGFFVRAPEKWSIRASGLAEMDFFGQVASGTSEAQTFSSAMVPRLRHFYFRIENPIVDILIGQYWHLFGWQNVYHPGSVQAQGLLGEIYSRDVQLRLSKTFNSPWVSVELAAAVLRPPQADSGVPQGEAGARLTLNKWKGMMTNGSSGTALQPLSVGVSGNFRQFAVSEMSYTPTASANLGTSSIAVDAYVPIIPATPEKKDNALSIHGEVVDGKGISDLYTSLTGGITFPVLAAGTIQGETFSPNVDPGMVTFDAQGNLHAIQWTTFLVGAQYYVPGTKGRVILAANYSHMESGNIAQFTQTAAPSPSSLSLAWNRVVIQSGDLYDANLFVDVVSGVRLGLEGALTKQHYVDGIDAQNVRVQAAGMFNF